MHPSFASPSEADSHQYAGRSLESGGRAMTCQSCALLTNRDLLPRCPPSGSRQEKGHSQSQLKVAPTVFG
jgi:hypothetical protein